MVIVAHEAHRTLGLALASVVAQTMEDWECIVVDDGSSLSLADIVAGFSDRRIQLIRLKENRGRGFARSRALEALRGRLCAFLDADDWMYPDRLERQTACLDADSRLKLIASSLVIEDASQGVLGIFEVRSSSAARFGNRPFSFASILIDSDAARRIGFRPELTRSEDIPFVLRALEQPWSHVDAPLYVYRPSPPTRASVLESHRCSRRAFSIFRSEHPLAARRMELLYGARELVHRVLSETASHKLTEWARRRAVRPASPAEQREHDVALRTILNVLHSRSNAPTGPRTAGDRRA